MSTSIAVQLESAAHAEYALASAVLADNATYFRVIASVNADDFTVPGCRKIFCAVGKLLARNEPADALTVAAELDGEIPFHEVGKIASSPGVPINAEHYARLIKQQSRKRNLRLILRNAQAMADSGDDVGDTVTAVMSSLLNLSGGSAKDVCFAEALDAGMASAERALALRDQGQTLGVSTTLPTLNRYTGGFHGGKLIVLGGRPGTFKSALAWQILLNAARNGLPAGMISLEMNADELGQRAIALVHKINGHALASGCRDEVHAAGASISNEMRGWPLHIDSTSCTLSEIIARIVEWRHRHDVKIVCVDHLQLMRHGKSLKRFEELSEITRQLKALSLRLNMPILLLSQLSRDVEKDRRRPVMSDLRECGNIEQDADIVLFLYCRMGEGQQKDAFELILAKQRGGSAREIIDLAMHGEHFHVGEALHNG